jgi:hypothetical protein
MMNGKITVLLLGLLVASPAAADEVDDRVKAIDDALDGIKGKLDGIAAKTSSSDVDAALEQLNAVKDNVDKLKSLDPKSDPAKTYAGNYPESITKFRESAQYLKRMKDAQAKADEARLHERCLEADRNLKSFMQPFVDRKDPSGVFKIGDEAERTGKSLATEYAKLQDGNREMDGWRSYARSFSESHNRWSGVSGKLQEGVNGIWERWTQRMNETTSKCAEIAKGRDSAAVKEAVSKLGSFDQARTVVRKKIDERLQTIASNVKDLDSRSGDGSSEISGALRATDELLGFLDELKAVQGEDQEARDIAGTWPSHAKTLRAAIESMRNLKAEQRFLDGDVGDCRGDETVLQERIRQYIGNKDEEGAKKLSELSVALARKWAGKRAETDLQQEKMKQRAAAAKAVSFPGGTWSSVKSNLDSSADKTFAYWNAKRLEIYEKDPCKNLLLGEENPDVKRAIQELGRYRGGVAENYRAVLKDFRQWERDVREFRKTAAQDAKEVREAFCKEYDWEAKVKQIADGYMSTLNGQWGSIIGRYDRMLNAVDVLIEKNKVKSAPKLRRAIVARMSSIEKVKEGQLLGSNNPKILAHIRYGIEEHQRRQRDNCPQAAELYIESDYCDNPNPKYKGSGCKLDCVRDCQVLEIKPDNVAEMEKGDAQARAYTAALLKMHVALGSEMFKKKGYDKLASCYDDKKDTFRLREPSVQPYPFCADRDENFFDRLPDMPTDEPPEDPDAG